MQPAGQRRRITRRSGEAAASGAIRHTAVCAAVANSSLTPRANKPHSRRCPASLHKWCTCLNILGQQHQHQREIIRGIDDSTAVMHAAAASAPCRRQQVVCHGRMPTAAAVLGTQPAALPCRRGNRPPVRIHACESSGSCAHSMQPAGQRRCSHASLPCTNTGGPHESKPRQSKQLVHATIASVVLNSAIASAVTPANPTAAVHASCAPLSSAAAPTHRYRNQTPHGRTKTSRGRANSSCARQ